MKNKYDKNQLTECNANYVKYTPFKYLRKFNLRLIDFHLKVSSLILQLIKY